MFDDHGTKARSKLTRFFQANVPLWLVLLVASLAAVGGRELAALQMRGEVHRAVEQQQAITAKAVGSEQLRQQLDEAHLLFGTAFAWAVRSAVMRNNLDQVELYFTQLMKSGPVHLAVYADRNGKIVSTTDKRLQGARFATHFPQVSVSQEDPRLERMDGDQMRLVLPIHGLSRRLGTVLLVYKAP